jgi:hypothetical protein
MSHTHSLLVLHAIFFPTSAFVVHYWGAFWTVVLLGVIQILLAYYNSHITIEALPESVSSAKRSRYRLVFLVLVLGITALTLLLARFNDSNQYKAELVLEQERSKQEALQSKLDETLRAINKSEEQLSLIREAIKTHSPNKQRSSMLDSLDEVQEMLAEQSISMSQFDAARHPDTGPTKR